MIHIFHRGLDAAAVIMAADDDVRYLQDVDRILDHGHHGHVRAYHLVRDISRDEDFARVEAHNPIGWNPTITTTNP